VAKKNTAGNLRFGEMAFVARVNETEIKNIPPTVLGSPLRQAASHYIPAYNTEIY